MNKRKVNFIVNLIFVAVVLGIIAAGCFFQQKEKLEAVPSYDFLILEQDREISALYADENYMYVGTNQGIHIYDAVTFELLKEIDNISMIYTASIISDGQGGIWVGHETGLTHIDSEYKQEHFSYPQIPKGRVNTVAAAGEKIYCGTYNGAAELVLEQGIWKVTRILQQKDGLLCDSVNVILPLKDGILYASYLDMRGGITCIWNNGKISYLDTESGLIHPYITSMIEQANGNLLVGTGYMRDGGLIELEKENDEYRILCNYSAEDGMPGEKIRYLYENRDTLWITTEYDGVLIKKKEPDKKWIECESFYLTEESGLSDNEIKCIAYAAGNYWLGGKYGLSIIPESFMK